MERERIGKRIKGILKLVNLRDMINLRSTFTTTPTPTPIFRDILQKSKQIISEWDGKMYFVYLSPFERYSIGNKFPNHDFIMQTAMNNKHVLFSDGYTREIFRAKEDLFGGRGMLMKDCKHSSKNAYVLALVNDCRTITKM